jgi:hypothetical protein
MREGFIMGSSLTSRNQSPVRLLAGVLDVVGPMIAIYVGSGKCPHSIPRRIPAIIASNASIALRKLKRVEQAFRRAKLSSLLDLTYTKALNQMMSAVQEGGGRSYFPAGTTTARIVRFFKEENIDIIETFARTHSRTPEGDPNQAALLGKLATPLLNEALCFCVAEQHFTRQRLFRDMRKYKDLLERRIYWNAGETRWCHSRRSFRSAWFLLMPGSSYVLGFSSRNLGLLACNSKQPSRFQSSTCCILRMQIVRKGMTSNSPLMALPRRRQ